MTFEISHEAPERLASVTYFKICRSHEEKACVEVEARRLRTSIHDESQHFMNVLDTLRVTDPLLAHQLTKFVLRRQLVNHEHLRVLTHLESS
ncbi:hypothetical protein K439DRAFT_1538834 [Ramaria rubella]|nr:hypothetical protein K439DRAFT_1538834 [Ramaria rubella]